MQTIVIPSGMLGVNTYFVKDDSTGKGFIVDPGGWNVQMKDQVLKMDLDPQFIILTHGHADHIMGIEDLKRDFPDTKIVANENEREMLADTGFNMSSQFGLPSSIDADLWVKGGDHLMVGDLDLEFIYTPGHSPGGMCIYIADEGILFSGDTLFRASIGRTDFPGCSFPELERSIHEKLWILPDDTRVYPGHMDATTIGFEKEHNPFV
jgi:glyoxylase-like metal-dependent hydrolase (beta-lactamase superfamily II)